MPQPCTRTQPHFYFAMALLVGAIVAIGFGRHAVARLARPLPWLVHLHAAVFTIWVLLFGAQAWLVRAGRVPAHRKLGRWAGWLGASMPFLGLATALLMTARELDPGQAGAADLAIPINDMLTFGTAFALALHWRRRPELHRRLMLMATCALTVAAFARFPAWAVPARWWYAYVDALVMGAALRDLLRTRRLHPAFAWGLPAMVAGQAGALYLAFAAPPWWVACTARLLAPFTGA
jgi:hypothetical protein